MRNPARHISRLKQGHCLNCGRELTAVSAPTVVQPRPGDVMVCGYCSHIMEWTGEKFVELSDEAIKDIAGDKDVLAAVEFSRRFRAGSSR